MLVIVDCQPKFKTSKKKELHLEIQKEIDRAIRYRSLICFLEYEDHGDTLPDIYDKCKFYDKCFKCIKNSDDGSLDILDRMIELNYNYRSMRSIRVCGINTSFCVKDTAIGLSQYLPKSKIYIIKNACNCIYKNPKWGWVKGNIEVI